MQELLGCLLLNMANTLIIPKNYRPLLNVRQTEHAIKAIKDFFELSLSTEQNLTRVTAPLFVKAGTGINDNLNGMEKPVSFNVREMDGQRAEIVQSLAKWKRMMLADLGFPPGYGLYTDINAIRPDEKLDNTYSLYVDQWDWERVIITEERNEAFLRRIVCKIYNTLKRAEHFVFEHYPEITFIHAEELRQRYPEKNPREREHEFLKEVRAAFIIGIGGPLGDGSMHDGRAPDYDDWITPGASGLPGLNGDIFVWHPLLNCAFELSSMRIRVSPESLVKQLEIRGCMERRELYWHRRLLAGELPLSIGGGIGQSRLCMYFLRKVHVGETQASLWPEEVVNECKKHGIAL